MTPKKSAPASRQPVQQRRARARAVLRELKKLYPDADCALLHDNPFRLLVATILSAQSTDNAVNKVTPRLFERYPDPAALGAAPAQEVEQIIRTTGFFRQKARNIIGSAKAIVEKFGGVVPNTMDELTQLPGVARKTANVVLGTGFGINAGVVVDTHVGRLADRLQLAWTHKNGKDAVRIEEDLIQLIPQPDWTFFGHALIWHGRKVCDARRPACDRCTLSKWCPSAFSFR